MPVSYTHLDVYKRQGTGRVDRTAPIRKEDAGAVRGFCLEHIDGEAFLSQWFRFAVTEQEILYSFDGLTLCPEVAGQTVGVQTSPLAPGSPTGI